MQHNFTGTGVALVTPFFESGEVDLASLELLLEHVRAKGKGVDYMVVLGTTGETATLLDEEKEIIFSFVQKKNKGKLPLVAGIGGNNTEKVAEEMRAFSHEDYEAFLSVSPYYNKPSQEGIIQHYSALAKASKLPIIVYNVPGRTGSNISASTTAALSKIRKIQAIKEASGDILQCSEVRRLSNPSFSLISGDDPLTVPMISIGATGVISVVANALPVHVSTMVRLAVEGYTKEASEIHHQLMPITQMMFEEGNPAGVKAALNCLGIGENFSRLPIIHASLDLHKRIEKELKRVLNANLV